MNPVFWERTNMMSSSQAGCASYLRDRGGIWSWLSSAEIALDACFVALKSCLHWVYVQHARAH